MRIIIPECSTCLRRQESEPSNVISQPVQALLDHDDSVTNADLPHDPAIITSILTSSSPIHTSSSPIITGTLTNQNPNQNTTPVISTDFGSSGFSFPKPPTTVGSTVSSPTSQFGNGVGFARSDVGYMPNLFVPNHVFGSTSVNISSVCNSTTPKNQLSSSNFPGFGVGYLPGSFSGSASTHCSVPPIIGASTTTLFPSSLSSSASNPNNGSSPKGTRYAGYAPAQDDQGGMLKSISASKAYQKKSHEELRWEDYRKGDKGGLRANAASQSIHGSRSIADLPQMTNFGSTHGNLTGFGSFPAGVTTSSSSSVFGQINAPFTGFATQFSPASSPISTTFAAPTSSSVQGRHETAAVSSKCSACGAATTTTTSSASGFLSFNGSATPPPPPPLPAATMTTTSSASVFSSFNGGGATLPPPLPQAATSFPRSLFPASGSRPMMLGTPNLAVLGIHLAAHGTNLAVQGTNLQAYPMIFGTNLSAQGTNLAALGSNIASHGTRLAALDNNLVTKANPMMFCTSLAALGSNIAILGTNLATQGKKLAGLAYPTVFGPNLADQVTNLALQVTNIAAYITNLAARGTYPALQAYPTMSAQGTNLTAQGTNAAHHQPYYTSQSSIHIPFTAMNLQ